jgi:Tol biopolymer transport system component
MGTKSLFRPICVTALLVISLSGCRERHAETARPAYPVADKTALLATMQGDEMPAAQRQGAAYHGQGPAEMNFVFSQSGGGVAYTVERDGLSRVVHNGVAGKPYQRVGYVELSPDGKHIAYRALDNGSWRMVVDGAEGPVFSAAQLVAFSPDGRHVAYQAMKGDRWYLVVDTTLNTGTKTRIGKHLFSGDSSRIAYIDEVDEKNEGRLVISDIGFRGQQVIATGGVSQIMADEDKMRVAAVARKDGKQRVMVFPFADPRDIKEGPQYNAVSNLVFGEDGISVAYTAERGGKRFMVLDNREESISDENLAESPVVRSDLKGVGVIVASGDKFYLRQFFVDGGKSEKGYEEAAFLAYSRDGSRHAFAARRGKEWFVVADGKEGPSFDRVVTPKFSPDGKYLVYRARKEGKRFVVVADTSGKTLREHPTYEQVYDVRFTADGRSVAYGVKDGLKLMWKVEKL